MLGRIELAQIHGTCDGWTVERRLRRVNEKPGACVPTRAEACRIAEEHAWKVLTNG